MRSNSKLYMMCRDVNSTHILYGNLVNINKQKTNIIGFKLNNTIAYQLQKANGTYAAIEYQ